jgi:erythromycin esterase
MHVRSICIACASLIACAQPGVATSEQAAVAPPELDAWIASHEIPLTTVEAGHGFADLAALSAQIGDARVVGLGEATHGSREIFQLKHRLIEYLVTQRGFTTLAFEAGFAEAQDVDDYVITGRGDPERAIAGLGYWPWMTDEVRDLVVWMRTYNRTHSRKVHFVGFDMQVPDRAERDVLAYLERVDPASASYYATALHMATSRFDFFTLDPDQLAVLQGEAETQLALLDAQRAAFEAHTSPAEWTRARQLARIVVQAITMTIADYIGDEFEGSNIRDLAMADNVSWILDTMPDAKVAIWAHNDHVSRRSFIPEFTNMGSHLADRLGGDLRVLGSAFDAGAFQALGATFTLQSFTVASGGPETLDGTLGALAAPISVLPLHDIPSGPVADYFAALPTHRDIGAGYLEEVADAYFRPVHVTEVYDALAFVATPTSARPSIYAGDQITPQTTNATATNLDFESGTSGWFAPIANQASGYTVDTTHALPHGGHSAAVLRRTLSRTYGKNYGELRQRFSAVPYRGKRVRLRAAIRTLLAPDARVHMTMRAGGAYDGMHDRPLVGSSPWQLVDIVLDVPAAAPTIQIGFVLVGDGIAWIDDVSLDVVP